MRVQDVINEPQLFFRNSKNIMILMEDKTVLRRNPRGLQVQVVLSGIFAILLGGLASWLIAHLLHWAPDARALLDGLVWIFILGAWAIASLKLWFDWRVKRYEVTPDALLVTAKAGGMGMSQTVYRYESIISIRMTQGFLGKQFGYGDVRVTIPKLDSEIVMNDIERPHEQLLEIQHRMNERGSSTQALIN